MPSPVHLNSHGRSAKAFPVDDNRLHYALFLPFPVVGFCGRNHFAFVDAHDGAKAKLTRRVGVARKRATVTEAQALAQRATAN